MKEGLNIAYLNGAKGYKKIVLGSQGGEGEGGNTGGGEGGSTMEYLVVGMEHSNIVLCATYVKAEKNGNTAAIMPAYMFVNEGVTGSRITAIAIDFNSKFYLNNGEVEFNGTVNDVLLQTAGFTQEQLDSIPRITKEQFYAI